MFSTDKAVNQFKSSCLLVESPFLYFLDNRCVNKSSWPQPHQSVLLPAEDQLVVERHVSKVLGYRESAQAVARVVEISGSGDRIRHNKEHVGNHVSGIWLESGHGWVGVCVCPDGVGLTCQAYPAGPLLGSDSTGGCTPARPAAQTSIAADSAQTPLLSGGKKRKKKVVKHRINYRSEQDKTGRQIATCGNL